ncbi:MAG TPA: hypothetical protein PKL70_17995 [Saprospiraceae bacterium]|nr:hypothetical protein [Saprospiraceae bacterium]
MVTVSGYAVRQNQEGESFVVLILQGDMELIQSQKTGRFFATAKKCTISSTFSEQMAPSQVGKQLPGKILREECDPYDFVIPDTGELVELGNRWTYDPDSPESIMAVMISKNGRLFPNAH